MSFETETCGRCGGSGKYSYCQMHGSTCFGCGGSGIRHTKRGAVAAARYTESLKVQLGSLVVGDVMLIDDYISGRRYFAPIVKIEVSKCSGKSLQQDGTWKEWPPMLEVTTEHAKYGQSGIHALPSVMVRKGHTAEFKAARKAEAIAYQATLTKAGKPRAKVAA